MIDRHHQARPYRERPDRLVEPFRSADSIDVSPGALRFGLPREFVREVRTAFPNLGFHRFHVRRTWRRVRSHRLSPLPMFRR